MYHFSLVSFYNWRSFYLLQEQMELRAMDFENLKLKVK